MIDAQGSQDVLRSGIETSHTNIAVQDANIAEAKAKLWQLEQDYHRFERLLKEESVPDNNTSNPKPLSRRRKPDIRRWWNKRSRFLQFTETSKKTTGAEAAILRKEADLDLARLNLSYTVITAPYDGHVGRRTLEPDNTCKPDKRYPTSYEIKTNGSRPITRRPRSPTSISGKKYVSR